jgi:hypothetical protein
MTEILGDGAAGVNLPPSNWGRWHRAARPLRWPFRFSRADVRYFQPLIG